MKLFQRLEWKKRSGEPYFSISLRYYELLWHFYFCSSPDHWFSDVNIPRKFCVNSNPTLRKIPRFPGVENLWKRTVSAEFREKSLKTLQNCAISKNFHTRYLSSAIWKKLNWITPSWDVSNTLHKKMKFSLRISSVNVAKSTASCGFGHIYRRNT